MEWVRRIFLDVSVLLLSGLLLSACRGDGILSSRKMVMVLTDLHKMDGMLQVKGIHRDPNADEAAYYDAVLAADGVTRAEFDSSLVWYTMHPQRFNKLYPRVMKNLEAEHELYVDESAQQQAILDMRRQHFAIFTMELVITGVQHGYPLENYSLPTVDTLNVQIPMFE